MYRIRMRTAFLHSKKKWNLKKKSVRKRESKIRIYERNFSIIFRKQIYIGVTFICTSNILAQSNEWHEEYLFSMRVHMCSVCDGILFFPYFTQKQQSL